MAVKLAASMAVDLSAARQSSELPAKVAVASASGTSYAVGPGLVRNGSGEGTVENVLAALDWVAEHVRQDNVRIVNMSLGTRAVDSTATRFKGRTSTYSSDSLRTDDGYVRDVTRTLPDGQVNQRSIDVSCDPAGQSCARTVVGGNGG